MYHLEGTVLTLAFMAFFLFLIPRMQFFRIGSISIKWFQGVFVLKVLSGFVLYLIYTYYYTDRSTSDIWKYYDDAMVMFSALRDNPLDYLQMLIGWGVDNRVRFTEYYDVMRNWDRSYADGMVNDTHLVIRFNAFLRLFSLGHYNVHSVVMNFLGLIGLTGIFTFLRQLDVTKERWFFAGVFLMPGIVFWTSGVLKEPLLLLGLGMLLSGLITFFSGRRTLKAAVMIVIGLWLLLSVKRYALVALLPAVTAWVLSKRWKGLNVTAIFCSVYAFLGLAAFALDQAVPDIGLSARLAKKQYEFYQLAEGGAYVRIESGDTLYIAAQDYDAIQFELDRDDAHLITEVYAVHWQDAKTTGSETILLPEETEFYVIADYGKTGSTIETPRLEPNFWSILKASPTALINAVFRPFPWNIRSPFMLLSGVENLIVLLLIILAIFRFQSGAFFNPIFWVSILFALAILILTGLVTPVVGAIVRYKVPALPFLTCALLALTNTDSIEQFIFRKFPFLKRYF